MEIFKPYRDALSDFRVTDIGFSKIVEPELVLGDTSILIINIYGLKNNQLAWLIKNLSENKPKAIGINKILNQEDSFSDSALASVLAETKNIVLSNELAYNPKTSRFDVILKSDDMFSDQCSSGFTNLLFDKDKRYSTVREFFPYYKIGHSNLLAFPVQIVLYSNPESAKRFLLSNEIPETINWENYRRYASISDFKDIVRTPEILNSARGKIVLLGTYDPENDPNKNPYRLNDKYFTPLNPNYAGRAYPDMYEIDIHANIISMILHENFLYLVPDWLNFIISFIFCYLTMMLYIFIKKKIDAWYELLTVFIFVILSIIILFITIYSFHVYKIDLQLNVCLLAIAISSPVFEAYFRSVKPITTQFLKNFSGRKNYER